MLLSIWIIVPYRGLRFHRGQCAQPCCRNGILRSDITGADFADRYRRRWTGCGPRCSGIALSAQLTGLLGPRAVLLKAAIQGASQSDSGVFAAAVALVTLLASASGVFGEMQASLNKIWRVGPLPYEPLRPRESQRQPGSCGGTRLSSTRFTGGKRRDLGLGELINARLPLGTFILSLVNTVVSLSLLALLFGAIYKFPDRSLAWFDVRIGAIITAILFTIGKSLIGWYLQARLHPPRCCREA